MPHIIESYKTVDGRIFEDEGKAIEHEVDLIGAELDGLIFHILNLDASKGSALKGILAAIKSRKELTASINKLATMLNF